MMYFRPVFVITVFLITVLSLYRIFSSDGPRWYKVTGCILRVCTGLLLIIAFLEPVFSLQRFPDPKRPVPVLVDASESMRLFPADSIIRRFRHVTDSLITGKQRRLSWYLFGDSLRRWRDVYPYQATDKRSFLPTVANTTDLLEAGELIVISDANWSNPSPVASFFSSKSVWYIPLSRFRQPPGLTCTMPDTINSSAGTPYGLSLSCNGNISAPSVITFSVFEKEREIASDSFTVDAGRFSRLCTLQLPAPLPGLHVYRITAVSSRDSLVWTGFILNHAIQSALTCRIFSESSSLDARFIRLAIARSTVFSLLPGKSTKAVDVDFLIGTRRPPAVPVSTATFSVFLGCLPGKTVPVTAPQGLRLFYPDRHPSLFAQLPLSELPPVTAAVKNTSLQPAETFISGTVSNDTIPILFRGTYRNRELIACTFSGFWKWDFLTLSHALGETDIFSFSHRLLSLVRTTLHSMHTDTLLVFPAGCPIEHRPITFSCVFPALLRHSDACQLTCQTSDRNGSRLIDTVTELLPTTGLFQDITLPPLPVGDYTLQCILGCGDTVLRSELTFPVYSDNTEMLIEGQNEHLLREIGQPLDIDNMLFISTLLEPSDDYLSGMQVTETFSLTRTWWLLSLIFLIFGTEWILRRVAGFE
jgi:hypothetical protein